MAQQADSRNHFLLRNGGRIATTLSCVMAVIAAGSINGDHIRRVQFFPRFARKLRTTMTNPKMSPPIVTNACPKACPLPSAVRMLGGP
ncbi:hypothetical protein Fuma_04148 [Fuerstiella marisgermanici]|uniref:Uncharacterized protein n=1 Tax=Fuerstiella marisgermanici TaxID=1891926 RepID=A0A1P8WKE3_9PLAN|nr:hypothetical protein Fuma_04148 [Fuerstiella marisgermanici]